MKQTAYLGLLLCALSPAVFSQAHVHGHGQLLIAQQQGWQFQFVLPAADVLGFEHKAETPAQQKVIADMRQRLTDITAFIELPADCKLASSKHNLDELQDDHHHHDHEEANIEVTFAVSCEKPLASLQVQVFDWATTLESIDTQWLTDGSQGAKSLSSAANTVLFK